MACLRRFESAREDAETASAAGDHLRWIQGSGPRPLIEEAMANAAVLGPSASGRPLYPRPVTSYARKPYDLSPLLQFLDGWFHEDWALDAESWVEVVAEYGRTAAPEDIRSVIADLDAANAERGDPEVARIVQAHVPDLGQQAGRLQDPWVWLQHVRAHLQALALPDAGVDERYTRFRPAWHRLEAQAEASVRGDVDAALLPLLRASDGTVLRRFYPFTSMNRLGFACSPYPFERVQPTCVQFWPGRPYQVLDGPPFPVPFSPPVGMATDDAAQAIEQVIRRLVGC